MHASRVTETEPNDDDALAWSVAIDEAFLLRAHTDLRRALVLQNARFARRADPFAKSRAKIEEPLRLLGVAVSLAGLALSALLVAVGFAGRWAVVLLVAFAILVPVFLFATRLRSWLMKRTDQRLARLADRTLRAAWAAGQVRRYRLQGARLESGVDPEPLAPRSLDGLHHALVGECTVALFRHAKAFQVRAVIPTPEPAQLASALEALGVTCEPLDPRLLPHGQERTW